MDATRVRELIGETVLALKEGGLWGASPESERERIHAGRIDASAGEFATWLELTLLPRIASSLAATERPEPVDGLGNAARTAFGADASRQRLIELAQELESALARPALSTELDQALAVAESSADAADAFYSIFANTLLIIPLDEGLDAPEPVHVHSEDEFAPLLTELDGVHYLAVFDREERLVDWAGSAIPHTRMSGLALALALVNATEIHVALNPGSGHEKVFLPAELAALREQVVQVDERTWICPAGNVDSTLLEALRGVCAAEPVVRSAHLALRLEESPSGAGGLLLALRLEDDADSGLRVMLRERVALLLSAEPCEILMSGEDALAQIISERMPAFFEVV